MREFRYVIKDQHGMHARPAGLLVKEASKYNCNVTLKKGDSETDAKRILGVMGLGVRCGEEIALITDGVDEEDAMDCISEFLKENL